MPTLVPTGFPLREREHDPKRYAQYESLFDGQCWKVSPDEYDYSVAEIRNFVSTLKRAAHAMGYYLRTSLTLDNHVLIERRPIGYTPRKQGKKDAPKLDTPA